MLSLKRLKNRAQRFLRGGQIPIWYDPAYRLPIPQLAAHQGIESRRADYVIWYLLDMHLAKAEAVETPHRIRYSDITRVHSLAHIESLCQAKGLARIFAVDEERFPIDEVMRTVRLACGGTLDATRHSLEKGGPSLNLLGGFHHAERNKAGGLCPVNDIAIALKSVRAAGFNGKVAVLDLDAHPPDGTADCLLEDPDYWIGSLSGSDWGPLEGVDETLLPKNADSQTYLAALDDLLSRMPKAELTYVIAGGDILAGDRMGQLGVDLKGAQIRDMRVKNALNHRPSVWLPGGGYHKDSWKVLAHTASILEGFEDARIPPNYNPMAARYSKIAQSIRSDELEGKALLTGADIYEALGMPSPTPPRFMAYYTVEGLEYALCRYGILESLSRLGYEPFRVEVKRVDMGYSMRVLGTADGKEYSLMELISDKLYQESGQTLLYVHWLNLSNPLQRFTEGRPKLPGQDHPGLGLAKEATEMMIKMAERLELQGIAFRPSWYHIAFAARHTCYFQDPKRQGRFQAMVRDLKGIPLLELTQAVADGKIEMNGSPYHWEADLMVNLFDQAPTNHRLALEESEKTRFTYPKST